MNKTILLIIMIALFIAYSSAQNQDLHVAILGKLLEQNKQLLEQNERVIKQHKEAVDSFMVQTKNISIVEAKANSQRFQPLDHRI